jgi:hypothetical protein
MRGHRQIIAARRDGLKPRAVFIDLVGQPMVVTSKYDEPENSIRLGFYPHVEVLRTDVHGPIDLRFLVGLTVHVHGQAMDDDMGMLLDRIEAEKPMVLVACAGDDFLFWDMGGWKAWAF